MIIGITGSSGAGKSTVCNILKNTYNAKIIDSDKIAKKLSEKGTGYIIDIIKTFGNDIVDEEGNLKRKKLAEIIYSNPEKRNALNNCTFKYILKEIKRKISKELKEDKKAIILIDAPLLFEAKLNEICDIVIGVIAPKEQQLERIVARDNIDYEEALKRILAQKDNEFYIKHCNFIINNDNLFELEDKVKKIGEDLKLYEK